MLKLSNLRPTKIFDAYWRFAAERQNVFWQRVAGVNAPWTDDPIINKYRFTNAYRSCDRVSQYLISNVIYDDESLDMKAEDILFRILLFKIFNKIETWECLKNELGTVGLESFNVKEYNRILNSILKDGGTIYSGAYIMPPVKGFSRSARKHSGHIQLLKWLFNSDFPMRVQSANSLDELYVVLKSCPGFGSFLAFQYAIDINYSEQTQFGEMDFVVAGPGARSGIKKCFSNAEKFSYEDIIKLVTESQAEEFKRLGLEFNGLPNRELQLIDCQNLFCEIDKYSRVAYPDAGDASARKRIKQTYKQNADPIKLKFPPKWKLKGISKMIGRFKYGHG